MADHGESASASASVCGCGVGGDDQTAICATVASSPIQQAYASISWHITFWQWHYHTFRTTKSTWTLAHTWTLYIHIKIAPLVWDTAEKNIVPVLASPKATKAQAYEYICTQNKNKTGNKKGITSIENWWMAKYNLFAMFHMFFLCLSYSYTEKWYTGTCVCHIEKIADCSSSLLVLLIFVASTVHFMLLLLIMLHVLFPFWSKLNKK